jgi:hypothetical protein
VITRNGEEGGVDTKSAHLTGSNFTNNSNWLTVNEVGMKHSNPLLNHQGTIIENPLFESCTQVTESREYQQVGDTADTQINQLR